MFAGEVADGRCARTQPQKKRARTRGAVRNSGAAEGGLFLPRLALGFEHFGFDAVALQGREVFHKHFAQQVVELMLNAHGQQTFGFDGALFAMLVEGLHLHMRRARTLANEQGNGLFWEDVLVDQLAGESA